MQYILSEIEYELLQKDAVKGRGLPTDKQLQELCTKIAETMPITVAWKKEQAPHPWGCIITKTIEYCDECPVQKICPCKSKRYSQ